jgi:hypothetical protein
MPLICMSRWPSGAAVAAVPPKSVGPGPASVVGILQDLRQLHSQASNPDRNYHPETIAAFADPSQSSNTTAGVLARGQSQPGRELTTVSEDPSSMRR